MGEKVYEYFRTPVIISGRHKLMVDKMWRGNKKEDRKETYVNRLLDLYALAAIVGIRIDRRGDEDPSDEKRTIFIEQLMGMPDLDTIMTTVLLLADSDKLSAQERIDRAFRGPRTKEEFDSNVRLFHSYVLGGIEFLYEELVERNPEVGECSERKIANIAALLDNELLK